MTCTAPALIGTSSARRQGTNREVFKAADGTTDSRGLDLSPECGPLKDF